MPLIGLGALAVILWQGRGRWTGLAPLALAFWLWAGTERPAVLIAESGGLVGVMQPGGRVLSKATGDGYAARAWLENDGDRRMPEDVARPAGDGFETELAGLRLRQLSAAQLKRHADPCHGVDLVVSVKPVPGATCMVLDPGRLRVTGSVAIWQREGGPRIMTATARAGRRPWVPRHGIAELPQLVPPPEIALRQGEGCLR